jgi:hypothetical protein
MSKRPRSEILAAEVRAALDAIIARGELVPPHTEWPRSMPDTKSPALPLVHHVYRDFDSDGLVLPNKPYSLELPAAAAGAIAAHVAVIPHESHASERFRAREAVVVDGRLRLELEGSGVVSGVSVLFVLG